jgi:hypothetical protein
MWKTWGTYWSPFPAASFAVLIKKRIRVLSAVETDAGGKVESAESRFNSPVWQCYRFRKGGLISSPNVDERVGRDIGSR